MFPEHLPWHYNLQWDKNKLKSSTALSADQNSVAGWGYGVLFTMKFRQPLCLNNFILWFHMKIAARKDSFQLNFIELWAKLVNVILQDITKVEFYKFLNHGGSVRPSEERISKWKSWETVGDIETRFDKFLAEFLNTRNTKESGHVLKSTHVAFS